VYQIEKVKRFCEFGIGKKPALKLEFGEINVLFCDGSHGEFEILNDFSVCWEIES
jgi:prepilin-type processing-associated H-X9-DG protein